MPKVLSTNAGVLTEVLARSAETLITGTSSVAITATSDTLVTGMTTTPAAGTYQVIVEGTLSIQNSRSLTMSLYVGGSQVTATKRTLKGDIGLSSVDSAGSFSINRQVTVNGSQAIELRGSVSGGTTSTITDRSLSVERVA